MNWCLLTKYTSLTAITATASTACVRKRIYLHTFSRHKSRVEWVRELFILGYIDIEVDGTMGRRGVCEETHWFFPRDSIHRFRLFCTSSMMISISGLAIVIKCHTRSHTMTMYKYSVRVGEDEERWLGNSIFGDSCNAVNTPRLRAYENNCRHWRWIELKIRDFSIQNFVRLTYFPSLHWQNFFSVEIHFSIFIWWVQLFNVRRPLVIVRLLFFVDKLIVSNSSESHYVRVCTSVARHFRLAPKYTETFWEWMAFSCFVSSSLPFATEAN